MASDTEVQPGAADADGFAADPDARRAAVWARVQLARNVKRPHTLELINAMATDVIELHGDRLFGDDAAIAGGFATIAGRRLIFIGHQKGAETDENIRRNFGMGHPEGFRKAIRLVRLAERLGLPVLTLIDTPGAFPGPAAEERGVAEAIARSIMEMSAVRTPVVSVITGEGGSGGALAIAVADVVLALENAIYSVISPEGCASILWRTPERAADAAVAMRLTAADQMALGVIDQVVPEPGEGAHTDPDETARRLVPAIVAHLDALAALPLDDLVANRYARFRAMGAFRTLDVAPPARPERPRIGDRIRRAIELGRVTFAGEPIPLRPNAADGQQGDEAPLWEEL